MDDVTDDLPGFSDPTRVWFEAAFARPTAAQVGAWHTIAAGRHALVVAPTGSGKTLSAFLWSIDRLTATERLTDKLTSRLVELRQAVSKIARDEDEERRSLILIERIKRFFHS